jgi:hypothetical protein
MDIFDYFKSLQRSIQQNRTIGLSRRARAYAGIRRASRFVSGENFPHHKHTGPEESLKTSEQPSLKQVFGEIEQILLAGE